MKTKIIISGFLCLFLIFCNSAKKTEIILDGKLFGTYTPYGTPRFEGFVKNIGKSTGNNCLVTIICYSDSAKTKIIDKAYGYPANLKDIKPNKRAGFEAIAFKCKSHDDIKVYDVEISWSDKER